MYVRLYNILCVLQMLLPLLAVDKTNMIEK